MKSLIEMDQATDPAIGRSDVVAEAIAASKKAEETRAAAIKELLARREQIDRDLKTLGYAPTQLPNINGASRTTREIVAPPPGTRYRFRNLSLAQIGRILLSEQTQLHGKEIERLAKAGGFPRGGSGKNFQNYLPMALKRAGGVENIGGNTWKLNAEVPPKLPKH